MEIKRNNSAKNTLSGSYLLETKYKNKLQFCEKLYTQQCYQDSDQTKL